MREDRGESIDNLMWLAAESPTHDIDNNQVEYIYDRPLVVTEANKYFVIVASAPSVEAALAEMLRLKRKAPQYDFVVYAPYGTNLYYGIMIATWVSREVAQQALAFARRDVKPDAFIWKCPQEGSVC
jgi:hypothetical protein